MERSDPNTLGNNGNQNASGFTKSTRHSGNSPHAEPHLEERSFNSIYPFQGPIISRQDIPRDSNGLSGITDNSGVFPRMKDVFSSQVISSPYDRMLSQHSLQPSQSSNQLHQHLLQQHIQRQYRQQQQDLLRRSFDAHSLHGLGASLLPNAASAESGINPFMNPLTNLLQGQNLLSSNSAFSSAVISDPNLTAQTLRMGFASPAFRGNIKTASTQDPSPQTNNLTLFNPRAPGFNLSATIDNNTQALLQLQQLHYQQLLLQQVQLLAAVTATVGPLSVQPSSPQSRESFLMLSEAQDMKRRKIQNIDMLEHKNMMSLGEVIKPKKKKKDKLRPKRPLSAYNLFFRAQREEILKSIPTPSKIEHTASAKPASSDPSAAEIISFEEDEKFNPYDSALKKESLKDDDSMKNDLTEEENINNTSNGAEGLKKRPHRKIGFEALAKVIGQRWNELKDDERLEYDELAKEDMKRYKDEMEVYLGNKHKEIAIHSGDDE